MKTKCFHMLILLAPNGFAFGLLLQAWALRSPWDRDDRWAGIQAFAILGIICWIFLFFLLITLSLNFWLLLLSVWLGLNTFLGPFFALRILSSTPTQLPYSSLSHEKEKSIPE